MKQKVLISAALLHNPDVLIFDEPLSGLDVTSALTFRHLLTCSRVRQDRAVQLARLETVEGSARVSLFFTAGKWWPTTAWIICAI
jgi:ABC-2 type transport system ATP-binding protein